MSDPRFDIILERIIKSYPNACVLYIDEIINPELKESYNNRKIQIKKERGFVEEKSLFHGTPKNNVDSIAFNGFDPTLNTRAAYGYGVYFAEDAGYSQDYMNKDPDETYMFLCDVLVGKTGTGGKRGDPNIDNNTGPKILTTVYPDGAYPRFIIAFYKNV
jgi:hypothetical protein